MPIHPWRYTRATTAFLMHQDTPGIMQFVGDKIYHPGSMTTPGITTVDITRDNNSSRATDTTVVSSSVTHSSGSTVITIRITNSSRATIDFSGVSYFVPTISAVDPHGATTYLPASFTKVEMTSESRQPLQR